MLQRVWTDGNRKMTVCVDAFEDGVIKGRILTTGQEPEAFESLMQFLMAVETVLDEQQSPQSYTSLRKFQELLPAAEGNPAAGQYRKGTRATFELQVLFRQHSSWQGVIIWREQKMEQSFRSVLELVMLMNSALKNAQEGVA